MSSGSSAVKTAAFLLFSFFLEDLSKNEKKKKKKKRERAYEKNLILDRCVTFVNETS